MIEERLSKYFILDPFEVTLANDAPEGIKSMVDDLAAEIGVARKAEIISLLQDAISDIEKRLPEETCFEESPMNTLSVTMNISDRSREIARKLFEEKSFPERLMLEVEKEFGNRSWNMAREVITVFECIVSERVFEKAKHLIESEGKMRDSAENQKNPNRRSRGRL